MESKRLLRSSAVVLASVFIPGSATANDVLKPPSDVTAVASSESRIEVSWRDNSSNETGFEVHRSTTGPNGPFTLRATTAAQTVRYGDGGLNPSTQYCYKIRAVRVAGGKTTYSALSAAACAATLSVPPAAPTNVTAAPVSDRAIDVTWQDNSADESGFEVHRSTTGPTGPFVSAATTPPDARLHTDAGLNASTQYCYKVRSFRGAGTPIYSGFSNTACATTLALPASELHVTATTTGIELDPDGYRVEAWKKCGSDAYCDVVSAAVPANGTTTMPGLEPADYDVRLRGIALNCDATSSNPQPVHVPSGGAAAVAFTVACAPDTKLAFASLVDGNAEIHVINATGLGRTRLTFHPAYDSEPAWSPDGARIAFRSDRDGTPEIYVMEADGANPRRLTWAGGNFGPAWSPDGARIAFTSRRDGNHEIYVMNADGTGLVNLTNHASEDMDPAWSPDGTRIAFTSNRDGWVFAINVMNADGSDVTMLNAEAKDGEAEPAWSPEGARIAFSYFVDGLVNIGVKDLVDGSGFLAANVWSGPCGVSPNPVWSPDGGKLAYTASGGGPPDCVISAVRLDDFSDVVITEGFDPSWRR